MSFNYGYSGGFIIPEFGLVIIAGVIALFVNYGFIVQVGRSRRKFGIEAPRMTETSLPSSASATTELLETAVGETPDEYRRYQRVHLNNVENAPFFYALLIFAGIGYPFGTFFAAMWFQLFRIVGAIGYYKSSSDRKWGALFHLGELVLVGLSLATAGQMLHSIGKTE